MEKLLRSVSGFVLISAEGEQTERFLNLCRSRGIVFRKLCRCGEQAVRGEISLHHFFLLRPLRRKTNVHIRVLKKNGLPFFFFRSKKRKAFFLGIFLCLCLLAFLSARIWNIHVEGNRKNTTEDILEFLRGEGVEHGMAKKRVNCSGIAASIRKAFPEVTWVSARIQGTRLLLTIQEGNLPEEQEEKKEPCHIAADVGGTIVKMVTRCGVPQKKPGDVCEAGDLLVMGRLDLYNDSQEVIRSEFVHADADIYVLRRLPYYDSFPLKHTAGVPTGKAKHGFSLRAGRWYFSLEPRASENWRRLAQESPLRITENFFLPVFPGSITLTEYQMKEEIYTREEARRLAGERLWRFEENLMEKGLSISANNVKIDTDQTTCTGSGYLEVIEKIGKEVPAAGQEQPERTSEDGEQHY